MSGVSIIVGVLNVFTILIFVRAILSWFPVSPRNPLVNFVRTVTDPILVPFSRIVPRIGMIDITPMAAIILLQIVAQLVDAYAG